jgi:hypothetical protein
MDFMEAFVVIDETAGYVQVAKYELATIDFQKQKLKSGADVYGWAPKDKMLLWRNSLVNPITGFTLKALTVNTPENLKNTDHYVNNNVLRLYDKPDLQDASQNENDVRLFQFLFILKEEGDAILVGKDEQIDIPDYASQEVLGWISKEVTSIWDQRIVMEPNYEEKAVEERKEKQVKVSVFENATLARQYSSGGLPAPLWEKDPLTPVPMPSYIKRFPILDETTDGIVRTGVVSDIFNKNGEAIIKTEEYIQVEKEYNRLRDKFRKINIMFVIDGTTSMDPYFAPLIRAIDESQNLFAQTSNEYRIGALVYRDYPEERCSERNRLIDLQPLTPTKSYAKVNAFLNRMIAECKDCMDKDKPEAVWYALKSATQQFSDPEQTNIVVLIGDTGNRPADDRTSKEEVARLLARYNCSLLAYQVANADDPSYNDFIFQANEIINTSCGLIASDARLERLRREKANPKLKPAGMGIYRLEFPEKSPVPGSLIHPRKGDRLEPVQLQKEIEKMVEMINSNQEEVLEGMESKLKSTGRGIAMNEAMFHFLSRFNITNEDLLQKASYENFQLFITGYTPLQHNGLSNSLFKYDILVNSDEVFELKRTLKELTDLDMTFAEARKKVVNSYQETLFQHYGKNEGKQLLRTATIGDVIQLVTGLPSKSELLNNYRIADLESKRVVDDNQLQMIIQEIKKKLDRLESEIEDNDQYKFRSNDRTYYWLPQDVLP